MSEKVYTVHEALAMAEKAVNTAVKNFHASIKDEIERRAADAAAKERERCAILCDNIADDSSPNDCAWAIRTDWAIESDNADATKKSSCLETGRAMEHSDESIERAVIALRLMTQEQRGCGISAVMMLEEHIISLRKDAKRYRWLREQHWGSSKLCVVVDPKESVKPGRICPSREYLDIAVDDEMPTG